MLPIVLVLFVATSAFAAPSVTVNTYSINDVNPRPDNGLRVNSGIIDQVFELYDNADANIYTLSLMPVLNDLADLPDPTSQALAVSQTLAILGELANGVPGDACDAASAIASGGAGYVSRLVNNINSISQLSTNPTGLRYQTGPTGGCVGGGRFYAFESAWDNVLNSATPYNIALINELYCSTRRLYGASSVSSNNLAAAATAAASPAVVAAVESNLVPLTNFLRAAISGGNVIQAAAAATAALSG